MKNKMNKLINDIEKAIDALKMDNALMEFDPSTGDERPIKSQNELNQCAYKANLLAISALEKQIPKKPVFAGGRYNCQCGWDICRDKQPYCMMCGNAIDWEV